MDDGEQQPPSYIFNQLIGHLDALLSETLHLMYELEMHMLHLFHMHDIHGQPFYVQMTAASFILTFQ